ncbi:hypothetical protein ES703_24525 [subsurface metagenome]
MTFQSALQIGQFARGVVISPLDDQMGRKIVTTGQLSLGCAARQKLLYQRSAYETPLL